ncbi:prephenate dehydrogenase, partial [Saprospiraceae bacterium]|nr:prephenate dehydrogenase [Saprospiraceae bacterium]
LIGGSIAKEIKTRSLGTISVVGIDRNEEHASRALELGLVDKIVSLEEALLVSDIFIVAVPVNVIEKLLPQVLDGIQDHQVILDVGSTKSDICNSIADHHNRNRFVAAHPLAGTEFSGPDAAIMNLFNGKKIIICEREKSDKDAIDQAIKIFDFLGMNTIYLDPSEHDKHMAFVSHLSHVISFALSHTVLDIEKDEKQIFNLASTGFASTARLAKCNPVTWTAIFEKNPKYLSEAIGAYITHLQHYKKLVDSNNWEGMHEAISRSNDITRVLDGIKLNAVKS